MIRVRQRLALLAVVVAAVAFGAFAPAAPAAAAANPCYWITANDRSNCDGQPVSAFNGVCGPGRQLKATGVLTIDNLTVGGLFLYYSPTCRTVWVEMLVDYLVLVHPDTLEGSYALRKDW